MVRALYGTKQAAHAWQQHLKGLLGHAKFFPLLVDPATYLRRQSSAFAVVGTHVDDLFIVFNRAGAKLKQELWEYLNEKLAIKDLGAATWTLQMLIQRDASAGKLKISQESFITEVLRRFNMTNCVSVPTPAIDAGSEATIVEADLPSTPEQITEVSDLPFLELIGCLWWLAQMSRLDIFVALQRASKWVAKPSAKLWRWLIHLLMDRTASQPSGGYSLFTARWWHTIPSLSNA